MQLLNNLFKVGERYKDADTIYIILTLVFFLTSKCRKMRKIDEKS